MSGTIAKLPVMIVALVIGLILTFTAVMPLVSDYSDAKTFRNEGYYRMSNTSEQSVIIWDPSTDKDTVKINDTDVSLAGLPTGTYSLAFADDIIVRFSNQDSYNLQIWGSSYITGIGGTSGWICTITVSTDNVKFKTSNPESTEQTITHTGDYFILDSAGDYIMKDKTKNAYMLKDSSIFYGGGISAIVGSTYSGIYLEGTVEDCTVSPMSTSVTASNIECVYTESSDYIDLVSLEKVTFKTTFTAQDSTTTDVNQTYNYFLVPYEVTADPNNPDVYKNLVSVLPLFALILLVAGAASLVYFKNKD